MANYSSTEFKRNGPQVIADNANRIALVKGPVKADTFAQFQAKIIAEATMSSADVVFAASGNDLQVTINGKTAIDPTGTSLVTDDIAVAVYSTVSEIVYLVQDAVDKVISNDEGDTVNIPALVFFVREATAAS